MNLFKKLRDATRPIRQRFRLKRGLEKLDHMQLRVRARFVRKRIDVPVIGVTGSSGKTSTTSLLAQILEGQGQVRAQFIENTMPAVSGVLAGLDRGVDYVVLEIGASTPGSVEAMATLVKPTVAIVTMVGMDHYASFRGHEGVAREKGHLVAAVPDSGLVILNSDDARVLDMAKLTKARVATFGHKQDADYKVINTREGPNSRLTVTIKCRQGEFTFATPFPDRNFWMATAAAFAAAVELGVTPQEAGERIAAAEAVRQRMQRIETSAGYAFVLDVKASYQSIEPSMQAFGRMKASRKTAIIGQISDYAGNPRKPYRNAYKWAREAADRAIFVGDHRHRAPATDDERASGAFVAFANARQVYDHVKATAGQGELVFIKSARNLHLERVALAHVQDVRCWEPACGKQVDCIACGMVGVPFEEHGRVRRAARRARWRFWRRTKATG